MYVHWWTFREKLNDTQRIKGVKLKKNIITKFENITRKNANSAHKEYLHRRQRLNGCMNRASEQISH